MSVLPSNDTSLLISLRGKNIIEAAVTKSHVSSLKGLSIDKQAQLSDDVINNITEKDILNDTSAENIPVIRTASQPLTSKAQVLLMMGKYQSITNNMDDAQRSNVLAIFISQSEARIQKARELSTYLDTLNAEFDSIESTLNTVLGEEYSATEILTNAESKLNAAQKKLADLLLQMGITDIDDPAGKNDPALQQAIADVSGAEDEVERARLNLSTIRVSVVTLREALQGILDKINANTEQMNKEFGDLSIPPKGSISFNSSDAQSEKAMTKTAVMIMLITEFIMKMEEVASEKLKSDLELNRLQLQARQDEMKRKSDEYEQQVKKAEDAQKMASCIGKILGGLAIALGAITTVFGGGGVALMAIGIGLMVADPIMTAITGKSLTEMVMNPLMEHVFMPLMSLLSDIVTEIFDKTPLGLLLKAIDKATGANMMDTIHTVVTAAVTIAAVVAIALVAKTAVKFMIDKMSQALSSAIMQSIKQAITQAVNKMLPQAVTHAARQGGAALSQAVQSAARQIGKVTQKVNDKLDDVSQKVTDNMMQIIKVTDPDAVRHLGRVALNRLDMLRTGVQTTTPIVQTGMNINIANIRLEASKSLAAVNMASVDISILRDLLNTILSRFKNDNELTQMMNVSLSSAMKNSADASRTIVRNIKA